MSYQDWNTVTLSSSRKQTTKHQPKGDAAITVAMQSGQFVDSIKKYSASTNKQTGGPLINVRKVEEEDSAGIKLKTVSVELKNQIATARQAKGWTQKELAVKINEKQTLVAEYESGKAIIDQRILTKMSKQLGVTLKR